MWSATKCLVASQGLASGLGRSPMQKVLYIAGWGRSGTTVVDNILNEYPGVFATGELRYLFVRGLAGRGRCGCGERVANCPLWNEVLAVAFGTNRPDAHRLQAVQDRAARVRHTVRLRYGRWPEAAYEYARLMGRLYRAIGKVTGASLIVDSSKQPPDAAILARASEVDPGSELETYLVHMVRDPRAVAYSWSRPTMRRHSTGRSSLNWLAWNGLTELVAPQYRGRFRRLRYEDLVANPRAEVEALLDLAGVPVAEGPFRGPATVQLGTNHTVSGNPRRFRKGEVEIRADDEWRAAQGFRARATVTAITLPLLPRYRYPLWPRADRSKT